MILGIDTSTGTAVAVIEADGVIRSQLDSGDPRGHAEVIGTMIRSALAEAGATPADIERVAVGMGPGPFTGLRVGIAAARAFARGRGIPCLPVVSHDAAALALLLADPFAAPERFAVVTDARRREFAYSVYDGIDDDGLPLRATGPVLAARDDLDAELHELTAARRDVQTIPAGMIALAAARAEVAGRRIASDDVLYLRAPDVTPPRTVAS